MILQQQEPGLGSTIADCLRTSLSASWGDVVDEAMAEAITGSTDESARRKIWCDLQELLPAYCDRLAHAQSENGLTRYGAGGEELPASRLSMQGNPGNLGCAGEQLREALRHAALAQAITGPRSSHVQALLWQTLTPRIRCQARRFAPLANCRKGMSAEDLEQEAFIKFQAVIPRYQPHKGSLWSWFAKVLQNHFVQMLRPRTCCLPWEDSGPINHYSDDSEKKSADPGRQLSAKDEKMMTRQHTFLVSVAAADSLLRNTALVEKVLCVRELRDAVDDVCWSLVAEGFSMERMKAFRLRYIWEMKLLTICWYINRSIGWVHTAIGRTREAFRRRFVQDYPGILQD